jgi:hypothetical protein
MLQSGALAAEDMRWLLGPRTVIIAPELLPGRTVAQNIVLLALSNFADRSSAKIRAIIKHRFN